MRRVAITGIGAVTPVGNDAKTTWESLKAGRSGLGPITTFDASTMPVRIAGMVKDFDVTRYVADPADRRHLSRAAEFGAAATVEAMEDAGLAPGAYAPEQLGMAMGGSVGRADLQELADMAHVLDASGGSVIPRQAPSSVLVRDQNVGLAAMARIAGCQGPLVSVSTACSGAAHALGEAYRRVQEGDAVVMLAGGFDALTTWLDVLGFTLLGALAKEYNDDPQRASRPFDANRSGFVLGEGAVVAVLEDLDAAVARGAQIHAELVGYGSSLNAYRITDAPPDGGGTITAMQKALDDAGVGPEAIDYVVAHGTGTHGNDICETAAIKAVFGDEAHRVAISSPKSMTGHLTSAAGGVGLVAALGALREQIVPPTINLDTPDPKLDLDYVPNTARSAKVDGAIVNAFAFGGTNASLVVRGAEVA
jgi:3-oxoacyl-[acyl-carrier-protein] synthase II